MKRLTVLGLSLLMVFSICLTPLTAMAADPGATAAYYYKQLTSTEAKGIYNTLAEMRDSGKLQSGTYTVDLVKAGVLQNQAYEQAVLMADFIAGRDAFMLDNADLFYVDFDKISISQSQAGSKVSITLGVGRDSNYFRQGFNSSNVSAAIADFEREVSSLAAASKREELKEQVKAAYEAVMDKVDYALEHQASEGNADYVRTPYGALVRGESVCEGYARGLKAVLDRLGVTNVLVQGTYVDDNNKPQPHMWNYVRMDDNRWYLVDATMGDGVGANKEDFFLKSGSDSAILKPYQPDGVISLSRDSMEFNYPNLSGYSYEGLKNNAFTLLDKPSDSETNKVFMSYKGMGVSQAKEKGKYIIVSYDGNEWYYYDYYIQIIQGNMSGDFNYDFDGYFAAFPDTRLVFFAVTDQSHPADFSYQDPSTYTYTGPVSDITKVGEVVELQKTAPVVVQRTPVTSRLDGGKSYNATATFSENLRKANKADEVGIEWLNPIEGAELSNFRWEEGSNTVSFTFTTVNSYAYSTGYYFKLTNLIGKESLKTPNPVGYTVVNNPSFACPKVKGDINQIYANTPALIDDSNLADNDWMDENGNSIANYASNRLALVASTLSTEESDAMVGEIESSSGEQVLASQTYDISMTLCSGQVSYISGKRVKVFVPFPEGFNAQSNASFKAYHFDKDGKAEEIPCVVTEKGIIMMCERFSPFAVVAVAKEEVSQKTVMTYADGKGSFAHELLTVEKGERASVTVSADAGYMIQDVKLNGQSILNPKLRNAGDSSTILLNYNELKDGGNTLEATFALKNVQAEGSEALSIQTSAPEGVTITAPAGGWFEGMNSFTVSGEKACLVLLSQDGGASYRPLTAVSGGVENSYSFSAALSGDSQILVLLAGDCNRNGKLDIGDLTALKAACLEKSSPSALEKLIFDVNGDGQLSNGDLIRLKAAQLGKRDLSWTNN